LLAPEVTIVALARVSDPDPVTRTADWSSSVPVYVTPDLLTEPVLIV
jgi:hypothetical protein